MVGTQILDVNWYLLNPFWAWFWTGIGILAGVIFIGIAIYFLKDLGRQGMDDLAKVLWVFAFLLIPILSWIAYYIVVMKE